MSESTSKSAAKEKKTSDKDLDLSNAARGVWLVKVPKYMADKWEASETPAELGKLKISRKPGMKPSVSFTLSEKLAKGKTPDEDPIPREHKFNVSTVLGHTLAVFSHTAGDPDATVPIPDKQALEGKVVQRAECRPIQDSVYMKLKHKSFVDSLQPKKTTVQLNTIVQAYKPKSNHAGNIAYEKQKKGEGKKSRDDKDRVMEVLFGLFEKHQYYNIRDLATETRQPITYLKEILSEVCQYNVKNPHKNMWELKPEYRHYKPKQEDEKKMEEDDSSEDD